MAQCPHCSESIDSLSGFMSTSDVEKRINNLRDGKNEEITVLSGELASARTKAQGYDAIVVERDGFRNQIEARTKKDARTSLLTELGVDPALLESFEQVHAWSQNGVAEDQKQSFEDWSANDASKHILLSDKFNGAAPPPSPPNPNAGSGINTLPDAGSGNAQPPPPPHNGRMTNEDLAAILQSPAYQALGVKEKQAKIAQLKQGVHA